MSGELFLAICLGALAIFILWEGWRRRRPTPLPRSALARGFEPGATNREAIWFTLAFTGAAFGATLLSDPPAPPFSGRGAYLLELLYALFGPLAFPVLILAGAAGALSAAVRARRKRLRAQGGENAS